MTAIQGRILVVDDDIMSRMKLSRSLMSQGYEVRQAENGQQALDIIQSEPFDLILLDLVMPGIDGTEVLISLKQSDEYGDIPVVMISGEGQVEIIEQCIKLGAEGFLSKPFDLQALSQIVSDYLAI